MKAIKYFLYVRKSTDTEDKQIQSIDDQINIMRKKAESLGIQIIEIFQESMSAKSPGRFRFNEMIQRIKNGEAKGVLAWKIDRLTRNPVDTGTIQYMLQTGVLDKIITNDRDYNPVDSGLLFSVETGMSNQFIMDLRKNVKRGMDSKTDKGVFCGKAPEGYINNKLDKTIEIDKDRYDLVRKMWNLLLTGNYTVSKITQIVNDDWGFTRKKVGKYGGDKFATTGLYKLFNNIFYTGDFMWKGNIKKGNHKAMITYEEFYRVQEILGKKGLNIRGKTREFAYTGFIKCGECGSSITAIEKQKTIKSTGERKTYIYYHCTKRKKGCECCSQRPIRLEDFEKQINDYILTIELIPEFKSWALDCLRDDYLNDLIEKENILKSLYSSLDSSEKKLNKLTDSLISEIITDEEYQTRKKYLQIDIKNYREKIEKVNNDKDESLETTEKVFNFIISAKSVFNHGSLQIKKEILRSLGWNWIIKDGKVFIEAFPWFIPIKKLSSEMKQEKSSLELIKNGISKVNTDTKNGKILEWYSNRANFEQIYRNIQSMPLKFVKGLFDFYISEMGGKDKIINRLTDDEKILYSIA